LHTSDPTGPSEIVINDFFGPPGPPYQFAAGNVPLSIPIWVPLWSDITATFSCDHTLLQFGSPGMFTKTVLIFWLEQKYTCINMGGDGEEEATVITKKSTPALAVVPSCECVVGADSEGEGGELRARVVTDFDYDDQGQMSRYTDYHYKTTPLGSCNGCVVKYIAAFPEIYELIKQDDTNQQCLCVSGGEGPYTFQTVTGGLATDQAIGEDGCISNGSGGSTTGDVTYRVIDANGEMAEVTCAYADGCAPKTIHFPNHFK
jgi:hypothetical protein